MKAETQLCADMDSAIEKAMALRESHDRLHKALADLVHTFHARPDIHRLCGPHEQEQLAAACYALNFSV